MDQDQDAVHKDYPHGRGYGHDYMRGGEVLGGYGYAQRQEYQLPRGILQSSEFPAQTDGPDDHAGANDRQLS